MSGRIVFNDGEGVEPEDFNNLQAQVRRTLFDQVLWHLANGADHPDFGENPDDEWDPGGVVPKFGSAIRPLRRAGIAKRTSATEMTVYGGLFIQLADGPLSADDALSFLATGTTTVLGGVAAAAAGLYRRDLIQCRITLASDPNVSRDFQDSVTDALSTSSILKRQDLENEFAVKTGSTEGTQAAANDATNLDSPDAGWSVLGAFLVDDTGIVTGNAQYWDFRRPWGAWRKKYSALTDARGDAWTQVGNIYVQGDGSSELFFPLSTALPASVRGVQSNPRFTGLRVRNITLMSNYNAALGAADARIFRTSALNVRTSCEFINAATAAGQIGARVSTSAGAQFLYDQEFIGADGPLWMNGTSSGLVDNSEDLNTLGIALSSVDALDRVYSIIIDGWGGF